MASSVHQSVREKARASYLGLAIGDALGATVEFMTANEIQVEYKVHKDIIGGGWLKLKPGRVTDDTEMSLALGAALLKTQSVDVVAIAESFSDWMRSKPVDIGNTVRRGIVYYRNHGETSVPKSTFNSGNGACMRTLPVALATLGCDNETITTASRLQVHITHYSDLSDAGTEHVINLIQLALNGYDINQLKISTQAFVAEYPEFNYDKRRVTNPGAYIVETLQAVFQSLYTTDSFESCLIDVVNRGGDADTTGAIAGMIAGACYGFGDIPERWLKQLDYTTLCLCSAQADDLLSLAPVKIATGIADEEQASDKRFQG